MCPLSTAAGLSLGRRVVSLLSSAGTGDEAARGVLREVGQTLGWAGGVLWLVDDRTGLLRWTADWADGVATDELLRVSRRLTFAAGVGLPGEVLASAAPAWVEDVTQTASGPDDPRLPRAAMIADAGLRAMVAVPMVSSDGAVGVMEFFGVEGRAPAREALDAMVVVGQQLAQYLTRVRVEERLRDSEAMSTSIVRAALDCVVTMDHRGRVVDFNPAAEAVFGYEREEAIGRRLADLIIPPELRDAHDRALVEYVEHRRATILNQRLELVGLRSDGVRMPVELTVTRLGTTDPPLFAGFIRDITERRDAEEQLARLLEREREERVRAEHAEKAARQAAEALQRSLLPPHLPSVPGLELGAAYEAGSEGWQVGGDFYDVFELDARRWGMVIGDVCGKGVEAAAMTTMVRYAVRAAAVRHDSPSGVLRAVNEAVLRDAEHASFCTAIYACIEIDRARPLVRLAIAGHPLPLLAGPDGVAERGRPGTLLGASADPSIHDDELELRTGELLLLYTDGVTETRTAGGMFGTEGLAALLASLRGEPPDVVAHQVRATVIAASIRRTTDDLAVLALRARP
jgi:sigma-B regulation protein RsbU (phosphoserine phosphatase)